MSLQLMSLQLMSLQLMSLQLMSLQFINLRRACPVPLFGTSIISFDPIRLNRIKV